jgi:septal ring-binding cell division protein DamX
MQLEGQIRDIDIVDRLVELWREKFTGAFRFEQDGVIKILYFKGGDVLSASTNDRTDSVDEILLRAGKVSREHVKQALAKRKDSETLGDALLNLGFITRKELTWARRVQVIGILRSISAWKEGQYTGVADYLPKREEGTLFPLPQVILEFVVTDPDRTKFEQAMDGGGAVFAKTPGFDETYRRLGLNEDADAIVDEIDGEKSAADVAAGSGKEAFNASKLIEALRALGLVTRVERTHGAAELSFDDFESAGVSDASDVFAGPELDLSPTVEAPVPADVPLIAPAPVFEPPTEAEEPQWGFDEAQLETVRRAAEPPPPAVVVPMPPPKEKPRTRWGMLVALLAIALLAGAGYYAWQWWQGKQAPAPQPAARQAKKGPIGKIVTPAPPPPAPTTPPGLTATMTGAGTGTAPGSMSVTTPPILSPSKTASVPPATATTTTAPARPPAKPLQVTATAPPPAQAATKTAPKPIAPPLSTTTASGTTRLERSANGVATITNTTSGAAPKPSRNDDALRSKYDAMAQQHAADPVGAYTVQFELVCETSSITKAMETGRSNVWWAPMTYRGKPCYRVFWGRFSTREEAVKAAAEIPSALQGSTPVVVKIPR